MEKLPHERVWNFSADPYAMEARNDFKCLFHGGQSTMEISHGQLFSFKLSLHGDAKKKSHAMDTWMVCPECFWSVVHGVAIPGELFHDYLGMISKGNRIGRDKKILPKEEVKELPPGTSLTILPMTKMKVDKDGTARPEAKKSAIKRWLMTEEIEGFKPLFPMTCKMCDRKDPMFLRHSKMHLVKREIVKRTIRLPKIFKGKEIRFVKPLSPDFEKIQVFRISYKCPECDWLSTFVVPDPSEEHFDHILALRDGQPLYYPPLSEWKSKDTLIQKKLEDLGYV